MSNQDGLTGPEAIQAARANWRLGQIAAAAASLMTTRGFHGVSVNDLAKEAGISVGTIYQYVTSKEDILELVVVEILETYRREVPAAMSGIEDPVERLAAGFRAYCGVVDSRRFATVLAYQESRTLNEAGLERVKALEVATNAYFAECIDEGVAGGRLNPVDSSLGSTTLAMLAHMWALKHWRLRSHMSLEEYSQQQLRLFLGCQIAKDARGDYETLLGASC